MVTRLGSNTGIASVGDSIADYDFSLLASPVDNVISGEVASESTIDDAVFSNYTPATVDHEQHIIAMPTSIGTFAKGIEYTSLDESIATVGPDGRLTWVANGTATIVVRPPGKSGRKIRASVSRTAGGSTSIFNRYVSGSLGAYASNAVDSRIAVEGAAKSIYTSQNHLTAAYVRNASCWANDIDLTPISPWNSTGANKRAGTLISPRHIIFATHYPISDGATIRFVAADNTTVTRTMTSKLQIGSTDFMVGVLDSDVPETISFARVMPTDWADYLPSLSHTVKVPCLALDQQEKALVTELQALESYAGFDTPDDATRLAFYEDIISGDSGNPCFLIDDAGLVLLTTWLGGGAGMGNSVPYHYTEINAAMTTLGGGYQLTPADWSGYNNYGA